MEDFVTYEIAVKLKEKGFNVECHAYYEPLKHCLNLSRVFKTNSLAENYNCITAPTISQVVKWLREVKRIHIDIAIWKSKYIAMIVFIDKPDPNIDNYNETIWEDESLFDTYEAATIAGIEYVIDNNLI